MLRGLGRNMKISKTGETRMNRRLTHDKFLQKLNELNIKIKPLDPYVKSDIDIRWQCDKYDNHIWLATPNNVAKKNGTRCPYCSGNKILKGFNDLWTTHPEIADCLVDKSIGYQISYAGHTKHDFICPKCGCIIKNSLVRDVVRYGIICPCCSDGISYPERFVSNILRQLKICYKHDSTFDWSELKRYDFYIEDLSLIIETHGNQHYDGNKQFYDTIENQQANDQYKMELAISNGVKNYIALDCRESDANFIKSSILNSDLVKFFDLSLIDWEKCALDSCKSNVVMACDLWNNGIQSAKKISEIMCLTRTTIINYLNRGAKYGICDYNGKEQMRLSMARNTNNKKKQAM